MTFRWTLLNASIYIRMLNFKEWINNQSDIKTSQTANGFELTYQGSDATGSLHAEKDNENPSIYRVIRVWAKPQGKGYGKKLYMAALDFVTKSNGVLSPAKNSTSDSAANLWRSLYGDAGVEKFPLKPNDWAATPRNNMIIKNYPNLRYNDPNTYPPKTDSEFWTFNSSYRLGRSPSFESPKPASIIPKPALMSQKPALMSPKPDKELELEKI